MLLNPFWYERVREAQELLHGAHRAVAEEHLNAPVPGGGGSRLFVVPKV